MKRYASILILAALAMLISCEKFDPTPRPDCHSILFYVACNENGLSSSAKTCLDNLRAGYAPEYSDMSKAYLLYYHLDDTCAVLTRLYSKGDGGNVEEHLIRYSDQTNSLDPDVIKQVLSDAQTLFPSTSRDLIISSHGTGFIPAEVYSASPSGEFDILTKSGVRQNVLGPEKNVIIEITDFKKALGDNYFNTLVFDCCLMAGVEVAYELKDHCDYMIAAPTEVMSAGITSSDLIEAMFNQDGAGAVTQACKIYMNDVRTDSRYSGNGTIVAVDCNELDALAEACKDIFDNYRTRIDTLSLSGIQKYYRYTDQRFLFDLDDFVRQSAVDTAGNIVHEHYDVFASALGKAVIFKDTTPKFIGLTIDPDRYSGLSSYIPKSGNGKINTFYKTLAWNKATNLVR